MLNNPPGETPPAGEMPPAQPVPNPVAPAGETPPVAPTWRNGEAFDPALADQALTAARKEADRLQKEKASLEAKIKEAEDAKLSEQERLTKRVAELEANATKAEQTLRTQRVQIVVERTARELDYVSEEAALRFLDQGRVEFDDDGQPTNVKALLTEVLTANPYLKRPAATNTPQPIPAHPNGGAQVGQMTPEQDAQAKNGATGLLRSAF